MILNRIEMARLLLQRGADPNANVWTSGSPAFRAYDGRNPEMIALIEQYGGWIDPGSAGYARQTDIARRMLAGEMPPHLEANDFSGGSVAGVSVGAGVSAIFLRERAIVTSGPAASAGFTLRPAPPDRWAFGRRRNPARS